jgi:hypothetical protein
MFTESAQAVGRGMLARSKYRRAKFLIRRLQARVRNKQAQRRQTHNVAAAVVMQR